MHRTAIRRKKMSAPLREAMALDMVTGNVLDYGCGAGVDVDILNRLGVSAVGYDPNTEGYEKMPKGKFKTVLLIYVLNIVQTPNLVLADAWKSVARGGRLLVACRSKKEVDAAASKGNWWGSSETGYIVGAVAHKGYQKGYTARDLIDLAFDLPSLKGEIHWFHVHGNPCVVIRKDS